MRVNKKKFIYLISPNKIYKKFFKDLQKVLETGKISFFQLRLKKYSYKHKVLIGEKIKNICKKNKVKFLINDDPILAKKLGADEVCAPDEIIDKAKLFTNGNGADAVVIAASISSNQPIADAGEVSRIKGRVVVVGLVGMDVPRTEYYKKRIRIKTFNGLWTRKIRP